MRLQRGEISPLFGLLGVSLSSLAAEGAELERQVILPL